MKFRVNLEDKSLIFKVATLIVLMLLGLLASSILTAAALSLYSGKSMVDAMNINSMSVSEILIVQSLSVIGLFIIPSILFNRWSKSRVLNKIPDARFLLLSVFTIIAAIPLINWLAELNANMSLPNFLLGLEDWMKTSELKAELLTQKLLSVTTIGGLLANILVVGVFAAISEELFFRGILQNLFNKYGLSIHAAIWLAALFFSAIHLQFYGFVPRLLLGAALGYMYYWSGSIWVPIAAHFANNFIGVTIAFAIANNKLNPEIENVGANGFVFPFGSVVIVTTLLYYMRKINVKY
jgi:hypothetical protein